MLKKFFIGQIRLLKGKRFILEQNLQNEAFMKEVSIELFYKEFKRLSELALSYSFIVAAYSKQLSVEFYDLHESFRELSSSEELRCAA